MTEVRAIKRAISERHGNSIDRLLEALMVQERAAGIPGAEQAGMGGPAGPAERTDEEGDVLQS